MSNPFRRKRLRFPYGIPAVPVASLLDQREEQPTMLDKVRAYLRRYIPDTARDRWHRVLLVAVGGLLANGLLDDNHAELWTRLGVASISLLFAWLYATDKVRAALYGLVVTIGGPLYAWGITHNVHWAVVVTTMAQALGMGTAVRKAPSEQPNAGVDAGAE